ncbi:MAG: alpha/beta hydrolase [Magnetococcales bacterium]|nr:alpha/beta hydrolase [Magnetococcales bacterium]
MANNSDTLIDHPQVLQFLFHPRREFPMDPETKGVEVHIPVAKNISLAGRLFIAKPDSPVILFWHGNGEIAADYEDISTIYTNMGITFLVVDFRGYGLSDGEPTGTALLQDAVTVFKQIQTVLGDNKVKSEKIYVMGRSMGSAAAIAIAADDSSSTISGLIIESGFAYSIPLMERLGGLRLSDDESQGFENLRKISGVKTPLLVIHGEEDQIIPVQDGQALFDAAPTRDKYIVRIPRAGHNDLMMVGQRDYFLSIQQFVK